MHFLTDYEKTQLKARHRQERDGRVRDRIKAVLLYDKQWSPQEIAEALLITDQAVRNHIFLRTKPSVSLTAFTLRTMYNRHTDGSRQECAKKSRPTQGDLRINLSGAIDVMTHNIVIQEDRTLNAESTIRFFQKIEEAYPCMRKIHVFCDNASYYRNKAVQQYLTTSKVTLHFLPPYSPNLNPIERLWKWMKEQVIYNTYYEHFEDFKGAVLGFFVVLSTVTEESVLGRRLRHRVRDKFRPIGAPQST